MIQETLDSGTDRNVSGGGKPSHVSRRELVRVPGLDRPRRSSQSLPTLRSGLRSRAGSPRPGTSVSQAKSRRGGGSCGAAWREFLKALEVVVTDF